MATKIAGVPLPCRCVVLLTLFVSLPPSQVKVRGGVDRRWGRTDMRLNGGFGTPQIDGGGSQGTWHADARLVRSLRVIDELALFGSVTNAASASAMGAFHYTTAGLSLRLAL